MMRMTTMKAIDTTTTSPGRDTHIDDDEKINNKLHLSSDWQRKLEDTNKSILSALIQHEEEQKEDKNEMKMLHLLHELPLDTEMNDEVINEEAAVISDCNVVVETKDTDRDVSDDADNDTAVLVVDSSKKMMDLDLINSSEPNAKAKAHKPMRRRSSLDYIRPPERCLLRNSSLNSTGFRSRSLRDVLEDKEADDDSSSSKDSNSMMRIPTRRISRGNSGKRRVTPLQMEGLPSRHLPRKSSAKGSGSFKGSLRRLMEDKETTDLGLGESCASLLSSCSLNSSNQRESIDIMDFGVQNDRYSGSSASASPSMASSALSLAPSATDGFVGWSRSDSSKRIRINLNPKPKADQTVSSTTATTAQRKRCESSSSSVISVDSSGFVNWVNKGQGENSSVHTLSASITSFSSTKEKEESNESSSTNNASSSSAKGLLRKLSTGLTRSTSKHSTWKANNEEHKAYHRSSTILFDETATIEDKQNEFMASVAQPMKPSGSRRLLNRLSRSLGSSLRKSSTSSRALRHSLPNTDNLSDDDDDYSRYAIPRFNADDNVDIGEFHRELYATKKNAGIRGRFSDVLFD